ncbi:ceruloplasmin [Tupaia chinensis]|uniref:ceruloplasmin n=1 Tax=Tupaia chinensis TaxID=246437 RepID=UPI0003C8F41D|nr:ceruloplasmin [Tupaia chinensis]
MNALFPLSFLFLMSSSGWAKERHYYIAIKETSWNYAPSGKNVLSGKPLSEDPMFQSQIGQFRKKPVFKKALYFQYTDDTFQQVIPKPSWLGLLGPVIKAETGDCVYVHVKNNASRVYSWHPHGLSYTKENEGALYPDNTTGLQRVDDHIKPGKQYTYRWYVDENQGPASNDSNCVTRMYHSHVDTVNDVSSGLIGPIETCKRGTLNGDDEKNIDRSYVMLFHIINENNSWYRDENVKTLNTSDPGFEESMKMYSINGYIYGNLPNLTMCVEHRVKWYFIGMGGADDVHSIYLHGQTLISRNHRKDTIVVFPASMEDAFMVAKGPGEWMLSCETHESMQALFSVGNCQKPSTNVVGTRVIHYYIAAQEVLWKYAPSGVNLFTQTNLTEPDSISQTYFEQGPTRIGGDYAKLVFRGYTDASFQTLKEREEHLGVLGPVIWAEVGWVIVVTFYNNATMPLSIQPHGLQYNKSNEGSFYRTRDGGTPPPSSHVNPNTTFVYTWEVPESVGPTSTDPDCLTRLYYSSVNDRKDINSGLVGPLLVCRSGSLGEDGKQKGVDKEFFLLATIFDENESYLLDKNIRLFTTNPEEVRKENEDFQESNRMSSINGYMYGNLPGLDMCLGDTVSWHVLSVGSQKDLHGIYFSGNTFVSLGSRKDIATVFPHVSETLLMTPDTTGDFNVVCMTTEHYLGGMKHMYHVKQCPKSDSDQTTYREEKTFYIAAEEIVWDFVPSRNWQKELSHLQRENASNLYLEYLGTKYKKVVYRQYDDSTFTNQTKRNESDKHLDILGPLIFANPGQILKIVFKNNASRPYSIHAHGVKTDSSTVVPTPPGEIQTYTWKIPERTGPTSNDFECIPWLYYSTVNVIKDTNSGLVGPLIVCRENVNVNQIVHRVLLFMIFDENRSWYFEDNIATYSLEPNKVDRDDETFQLSNQMHAINGRMFGTNQGLTAHVGDEVNWYLMGVGSEFDLHTVHFHGHSYTYTDMGKYRSDVYDLPPGTFAVVKMYPRAVGTWLFHCHVGEHIEAGMESTYTVFPNNGSVSS